MRCTGGLPAQQPGLPCPDGSLTTAVLPRCENVLALGLVTPITAWVKWIYGGCCVFEQQRLYTVRVHLQRWKNPTTDKPLPPPGFSHPEGSKRY